MIDLAFYDNISISYKEREYNLYPYPYLWEVYNFFSENSTDYEIRNDNTNISAEYVAKIIKDEFKL